MRLPGWSLTGKKSWAQTTAKPPTINTASAIKSQRLVREDCRRLTFFLLKRVSSYATNLPDRTKAH